MFNSLPLLKNMILWIQDKKWIYWNVLISINIDVPNPLSLQLMENAQGETWQRIWLVLRILFMFQATSLGYMFFGPQSITQTLCMVYALTFHFMVTPDFTYLPSSFLFCIFLCLVIQIYQLKSNGLMIVMKWPTHEKPTLGLAMVYHSLFIYIMIFRKNIQIGSSSSTIYFQY